MWWINGEGDIVAKQIEPYAVGEDDCTDEELDVNELERRMWREKMLLRVRFDKNGLAVISKYEADNAILRKEKEWYENVYM
ncbi:hypothetical protein Lal_00032167 [Lupinus albus]|nr:hypothetical protein Lal_00032167 [Lupinus albus]